MRIDIVIVRHRGDTLGQKAFRNFVAGQIGLLRYTPVKFLVGHIVQTSHSMGLVVFKGTLDVVARTYWNTIKPSRAANRLLHRECRERVILLNYKSTFDGSSSGKRPTRTTVPLILDGTYGANKAKVNFVRQRLDLKGPSSAFLLCGLLRGLLRGQARRRLGC